MTPIDPSTVGPIPAPFWFVSFFKTLGFVLHSIPMHLWLAGIPMALFFFLFGGPNAKTCSRRFFFQLPFFMAFGINLGIVPLLFVQVGYAWAFYPATILTAWHWFSVIPLTLLAYAFVYLTVSLIKKGERWRPLLTGTIASLTLAAAGLILTSNWTLMADTASWREIWENSSVASAVTGLGTAWNKTVFIRFFQTVALSLLTLSCWVLFDASFFYNREEYDAEGDDASYGAQARTKSEPVTKYYKRLEDNPEFRNLPQNKRDDLLRKQKRGQLTSDERDRYLSYTEMEEIEEEYGEMDDESSEAQFPVGENYPEWMRRFALCLQWFGLFTAAGLLWYYYYKLLPLDPEAMAPILQTGARHLLTAVLAALGVFGLVSIFALFGKLRGRSLACALFGADLLVVSLWAIARQMIQNAQLKSYLDVSMIPQQVEWSPLIIFLIVFVIGAGVVVYLINKAVQANS